MFSLLWLSKSLPSSSQLEIISPGTPSLPASSGLEGRIRLPGLLQGTGAAERLLSPKREVSKGQLIEQEENIHHITSF